jgi:hypothetical protein
MESAPQWSGFVSWAESFYPLQAKRPTLTLISKDVSSPEAARDGALGFQLNSMSTLG